MAIFCSFALFSACCVLFFFLALLFRSPFWLLSKCHLCSVPHRQWFLDLYLFSDFFLACPRLAAVYPLDSLVVTAVESFLFFVNLRVPVDPSPWTPLSRLLTGTTFLPFVYSFSVTWSISALLISRFQSDVTKFSLWLRASVVSGYVVSGHRFILSPVDEGFWPEISGSLASRLRVTISGPIVHLLTSHRSFGVSTLSFF